MSVGTLKMKMKIRSKLGNVLEKRGINKSWFAREIGATPKQVYAWCDNENEIAVSTPSIGYLLRMQEVLGLNIKELYEEIAKSDDELVKCLECGNQFEPIHALQKFCPPKPDRKRSTCENTYNQRIKRKRQKEREVKGNEPV